MWFILELGYSRLGISFVLGGTLAIGGKIDDSKKKEGMKVSNDAR